MQRVYDNKLWKLSLKIEKRKHKDDNSGSKRNNGLETMVYLKNRAEQESYLNNKNLN